jgi:hypothetical protein
MYDAHLRYLAVAFLDAESVRPNQEEITDLISEFRDFQLTPVAIQDSTGLLGQDRRVGFVSHDNAWQIVLLGKQFQVARVANHSLGADLGTFSAFCEKANEILKWVLKRFERRPHRLAAVQEGVLPEMSDDEIDAIARRLLSLPAAFRNLTLSEWDWRTAPRISRRIGEREEMTNTIVTIKKINGTVSPANEPSISSPLTPLPEKFSVIRADIDINTVQENTSARFQDTHLDSFFKDVFNWHEDLISEINALINQGE